MAKTARKHFIVDGWNVTEKEFSADFSQVAESVFSLGNEYMGSRGNLDEGTSAPTLLGSYFNGIYEYAQDMANTGYKGIAKQSHFMINAANYWQLDIAVDGKRFDMATCKTDNYVRNLSLQKGRLTRQVTWVLPDKRINMDFCRFVDMQQYRRAYQRVEFVSDKDCALTLTAEINFNCKHGNADSRWQQRQIFDNGLTCDTQTSGQTVAVFMNTDIDGVHTSKIIKSDKCVKHIFEIELKANRKVVFTRLISADVDKNGGDCSQNAAAELSKQVAEGYEAALLRNEKYWLDFWNKSDIEIIGDDGNQQGIRFCIFQLQQTYHGADPTDNIGAKGLTGEAYGGLAFWDTETYCLPYYIFNNPQAAKYLLEYRYATLPQAKNRAKELDCEGACYPISTINGQESCGLWQHASLQMQPSTGVAYGIYHYVNACGDTDFLYGHGAEMLVEISRYLVTRGQWDATNSYFGYYCVMGPDEFQMMVNHNTYTNFMAKKTFEFTLQTLRSMSKNKLKELTNAVKLDKSELEQWQKCADKMLILYDDKTQLYEQHDGFFKLPHINVDDIADEDFPLYSHWSYDRIYRNDMIKQPDVLMFQLLYNGDFTKECKQANYDYYEPRCIHESSLSPSVHSILACELNKTEQALEFFRFATRLDLDDYNRNTCEGLHTTSIAAAWMNIVYGFGGLRSDKDIGIAPILPKGWQRYSFSLLIRGVTVKITVYKDKVVINSNGKAEFKVYGKHTVVNGTLEIAI